MVFWGATDEAVSAPSYLLSSWLFLRLLGLIYLAAFISLATQIEGLIGSKGILPAADFLNAHQKFGLWRFHRIPSLYWFFKKDSGLRFLSRGGALLSCLLVIGVAPMPILFLLWAFYLSVFSIGRIFLGYQWDILLLEMGFLAIFLAPGGFDLFPRMTTPPTIIRWLLWWLLFRLMFSSGLVKLLSTDSSWRKLTALCHHYETQPLPTPIAWYAHQLPRFFHKFSVVAIFVTEALVPFLIFAPPPFRRLAALLLILLMTLIQSSGNYGFFNLLGIALSVLLLDDKFLAPIFKLLHLNPATESDMPPMLLLWLTPLVGSLILVLSLFPTLRLFRIHLNAISPFAGLFKIFEPFHLVNSYGLFSVMTNQRPEIIVEGSLNGVDWKPYDFKWKVGDVKRAPRFVAPHQPRLDWQMWFGALGNYLDNPWFGRFLMRLLEGSRPVLSLLRQNPFPDGPPHFVRATLFDYRFTNRSERALTGAWWRREQRDLYCPVLHLEGITSITHP